jgi:asparagine synthase (glutamine-hydrolysing)
MLSKDGLLAITYNGEVYNFAEIRIELEQHGHEFRSHTDTEVILNAYLQWGEECVHRFRGMFAFMIWDVRRQRLFAARDRLGVKPLYWSDSNEGLMLASELKAILSTGLMHPVLDLHALHHFLTFYAVPPPYTMLQGVHSLQPGHCLTWESGKVTLRQYWDVPTVEDGDIMPSGDAAIEIRCELRRLLEESIRLRMIADVPVGAFLSGGVDSSALVALMSRLSGKRLQTFSIGFHAEGRDIDERHFAEIVARRYDTEHNEVVISGRDVAEQLPDFVRAMDQPTGDGLNTYLVSRATANHVKVALSGLGGDELFAGYRQYRYLLQADRIGRFWRRMPGLGKATARMAARQLARVSGREALAAAPDWLESGFLSRYLRTRTLFSEDAKHALYLGDLESSKDIDSPSIDLLRPYFIECERDPIVRVTRLELKSYLAHMLLRDTDVMSMAHSLEVRVPLIDHKLVEFATRIPAVMKLGRFPGLAFGGRTKLVLTDCLTDVLPMDIIRRRKHGFHMPVGAWLRSELQPMLAESLSRDAVKQRGLFNPDAVDSLRSDFEAGRGPYMRVWALMMLELWQREFLD